MKRKVVLALLASMTLTMGSVGTVYAMNAGQFSDVKKETSFYTYVEKVIDAKIMESLSEEEFGVSEKESRVDFVKSLSVMTNNPLSLSETAFVDIKGTEYEQAVRWAENRGLLDGLKEEVFQDGKFDAEKALSREELAVILYNYGKKVDLLDMTRGIAEYDAFDDTEEETVTEEYSEAMKWAVGNKLLIGDDRLTKEKENSLRPTAEINKTETAEALAKYIELRDAQKAEKAAKQNVTNNSKTSTTPETPNKQEKPVDDGSIDWLPIGPADEIPEHHHTWQEIIHGYLHHDEVGHFEDKWVVDKPEWLEKVEHEEEGHFEKVLVKEAWTETIEHEAIYEDKWIVDKEAYTELVYHPETGHTERVEISPEEGHYEKVLVKEAWTETIEHPAEYEDVWVVDKEAWTEEIKHEEVGHYEKVLVKEAWTEEIKHEEVGHYENVLVKDAWTETIEHEAEYENKWVVDKEAWTEEIKHEEVGHYEKVLISEEEGHFEKVLISEEEGHFEKVLVSPEEGHMERVLIKEAWDEDDLSKPIYETRIHTICSGCHEDMTGFSDDEITMHIIKKHLEVDGSNPSWQHIPMDDIVGYEKIHHDAIYEDRWVVDKEAIYEDKWVVDKEAVYEDKWIVDKEAWTEYIEHEEEGHYEKVLVKDAWTEEIFHEAVYEDVWVVDKEAWIEYIEHEAVYEDRWIVDEEAWIEYIEHEEEGHMERVLVKEAWTEEIFHEAVYEEKWVVDKEAVYGDVWVTDKEAWTEEIKHEEEGHTEKVLVKDAWTETIEHEAIYKDEWVVDKEAWTEEILHKEEGHKEQVWVVDEEAWDEPIVMGWECTECGISTR